MWRKRIQIGLVHVAIAMMVVPADSTLNRIMINEMALSATMVAIMLTLPYLFSPVQLAIGSFADRHPIWGRRRSPYILAGLLLSAVGIALSPVAVFTFEQNFAAGALFSFLAFGIWGMGFNFATVSYFALASELKDEKGRSQTISTMYVMMIVSVIVTALLIGRAIEVYSPEAVTQAIWWVTAVALILGIIGLIGLENQTVQTIPRKEPPVRQVVDAIFGNRQARLFFGYLILLLAAILGQDVLLEPYGGEAFGLSVAQTTRLSAIYGLCFLITLASTSLIEKRTNKRLVANIGSWGAVAAFLFIGGSGLIGSTAVFYLGVVVLGLAIGFSTVANHSLMLDMTTAQNVGLFIGAWGMANALARLVGSVTGGAVLDTMSILTGDRIVAYVIVFGLKTGFLLVSLYLLRSLSIQKFQDQAMQVRVE
jgi:BCD family chlorophyll transporter-like MFS transporter